MQLGISAVKSRSSSLKSSDPKRLQLLFVFRLDVIKKGCRWTPQKKTKEGKEEEASASLAAAE